MNRLNLKSANYDKVPPLAQVWNFFVHLRWHYQLFILSGGFLLGGFLSSTLDWQSYLLQFVNVHLLLFGGATAYNSYWDRDEGPIGGLKNPPKMNAWMRPASIFLQVLGLLFALPAGFLYVTVYTVSMLLFWLYSTPLARWKKSPVLSLFAIGISTGTNSLLMGYIAAGHSELSIQIIGASVGVALIILSLYPVSQLFQIDEDNLRGDKTFAIQFGFPGVYRFYQIAYYSGLVIIAFIIMIRHIWLAGLFFNLGLIIGLWVQIQLKNLKAEKGDYEKVMQIKFRTSFSFVLFLIIILITKHSGLGIL